MSENIHDHPDSRGVFVEMWVVDMLGGDMPAALLFSQLLWWHQPAKDGTKRARHERDNERWLLRADDEWWEDCRMTVKQVRRVRAILVEKNLVECRRFKKAGAPTSAWRPLYQGIQVALRAIRPDPELPSEGNFQGSDPQGQLGSCPQGQVPIPLETPISRPVDTPSGRHGPKGAQQQPPCSEAADRLARAEWERRTAKPVCGFPALRSRIQEVLDAGHSADAVAKALPGMSAFSRNAFDFALGAQQATRHLPAGDRALADNPAYWGES